MKKKYSLTLLEIMIVIFLIGLIGSVIGYNMKGSLDQGRAFKTEQAAQQIRDVLVMEIAKGTSVDKVIEQAETVLELSGLVKDPKKLLKDGWGVRFDISPKGDSDVWVSSRKLTDFKNRQKGKRKDFGLDDDDNNEVDDQNS